jgi:transcriptional regulator GlxA family with amidase domain
MLRRYLPLLLSTLDQATPPFPDWWITQTEQFVITLVLCGHRHNYSHLLEQDMPDAGWRAVRRAEEYIEANAQRAITLEELAQATGVSTLTLFRSFKKYRGYSPTEFLSRLRAGRQ